MFAKEQWQCVNCGGPVTPGKRCGECDHLELVEVDEDEEEGDPDAEADRWGDWVASR